MSLVGRLATSHGGQDGYRVTPVIDREKTSAAAEVFVFTVIIRAIAALAAFRDPNRLLA